MGVSNVQCDGFEFIDSFHAIVYASTITFDFEYKQAKLSLEIVFDDNPSNKESERVLTESVDGSPEKGRFLFRNYGSDLGTMTEKLISFATIKNTKIYMACSVQRPSQKRAIKDVLITFYAKVSQNGEV